MKRNEYIPYYAFSGKACQADGKEKSWKKINAMRNPYNEVPKKVTEENVPHFFFEMVLFKS